MATSRPERRRGSTVEDRLRDAEYDLDDLEAENIELRKQLGRIFFVLVGVLASVTASAIVLAIQLGAGK